MNNKNPAESNEQEYLLNPTTKIALPVIGFLALIIGFLLNFSIEQKFVDFINKSLISTKICKVSVSQTKFQILSARADIEKFNVGQKCPKVFNYVKKVGIQFRGLSFSPVGVRTKISIQFKNISTPLFTIVSVGMSEYKVFFDEQIVPLNKIIKILGSPIKLSGNVMLDGFILGSFSNIKKGQLALSIKNLQIIEQEIQNFIIPSLQLRNNLINISLNEKSQIKLNNGTFGNKNDSAQILTEGILKNVFNKKSPTVNLNGKFKFKKIINQKLPILNILLSGKKKKQDFYHFSLNGKISNPSLKFK